MEHKRKLPRRMLIGGAAVLVAVGLVAAFWPSPTRVDLGAVTSGDLVLSIREEARTRVREVYTLSTAVTGRLLRVDLHPGDAVTAGQIVAHMRPTSPDALNVRTLEQAHAAVDAAQAALRVAQSDQIAAAAADDLAQSELARTQRLFVSGITSQAALDRAASAAQSAEATLATAEAAIALREAELASANALLTDWTGDPLAEDTTIQLRAPSDGVVLRVLQESETTLAAGTAVMEIGDIANDLEVVIDLISSDAVQVELGDPVLLTDWGGAQTLSGRVARIDPYGVTATSALGVREQRVDVVVDLTSAASDRPGLGHGYRLEAQIITWQDSGLTLVPTNALFREDGQWSVFAVTDGRAVLRPVAIGATDGISTEITDGLTAGDQVVLYPPASLADGDLVAQR